MKSKYLLEVWYGQQLFQLRQKLKHKPLQALVIFRVIYCGKHLLYENSLELDYHHKISNLSICSPDRISLSPMEHSKVSEPRQKNVCRQSLVYHQWPGKWTLVNNENNTAIWLNTFTFLFLSRGHFCCALEKLMRIRIFTCYFAYHLLSGI